jgi:hypothetical protein
MEIVYVWWLWIVVAMVLIAGPIFWARPTPRERRLAALRTDAMALGLKLSTEYVNGWTKQRLNRSQVQVYRLVCPTGSRTFRLWRFPGRIDWTPTPDTPGRMGRDGVLGDLVQTLPVSILSVAVDTWSVSLAVDEDAPGLTAAQIDGHLRDLKAILSPSETPQ